MLIWKKDERRNNRQKIISTSYLASVPYLGRISVHPHIHSPGEWFLTCQALNIDKLPLGSVSPEEAERLAETELVKRLERHILWCRKALTEIHSTTASAREFALIYRVNNPGAPARAQRSGSRGERSANG